MSAVIKGNAVLFSEMTPPPGGESAFNDWYDNHHMPHHVKGVPGFISGQRYKSKTGPHYLAVYELQSVETLESEEYRTRKYTPDAPTKAMLDSVSGFTRYIGMEEFCLSKPGRDDNGIDGDVIVAFFFDVPFELSRQFNIWFDREHVPILLEHKSWLLSRRMAVIDSNPDQQTHMLLHYLTDETALKSDTFSRACSSERYSRMARQPWFELSHRVVYHRLNDRVLKGA